jgi:hypothetical protein
MQTLFAQTVQPQPQPQPQQGYSAVATTAITVGAMILTYLVQSWFGKKLPQVPGPSGIPGPAGPVKPSNNGILVDVDGDGLPDINTGRVLIDKAFQFLIIAERQKLGGGSTFLELQLQQYAYLAAEAMDKQGIPKLPNLVPGMPSSPPASP